ncbi:hypothetical protein HYX07_04215 [Candidatus Woesearchaeota archaeon]|nr:hypothetical protein [Candidatus Woesearchaeota archaeon]
MSIEPRKIDPREEFTIRIGLNNQNVLNYENLTIKVESNLFRDELNVPLGPKEEKVVEVIKRLDEMTSPQEDRLVVAMFMDQRMIVNPVVEEFEVKEYLHQEELPEESSFLKIRKGVKVISNNPDYKGVVKIGTSALESFLLSTSPRAEIVKEDSKQYLVWEVKLGKDKTMNIYRTKNYRPIVVIAILAAAAVILYFLFRSPIVVSKSVANIGMSEGGISEAKIVVRVRNRSPDPITDIEVMDSLPHIAHVEKELSIGSMQPHAILKHPKKGLMIKWIIEMVEPGDERVLSYRMKSRLSILGEFSLPAATARAKIGNKVIISNSNRVTVSG